MKTHFTFLFLLALCFAGCSNNDDGNATGGGDFNIDFNLPTPVFTGEEMSFENLVEGVNQPSLEEVPVLDGDGNQLADEEGNPLYQTIDDGNPYDYLWVFGDGSKPSSDRNPAHIYKAAGSYTVGLRVTRKADGSVESVKK
ncbi:MAG: PKD domain-containing protein [Rikenellaceae bacterium]|jgi:hypothetical protein|nr:PKD domain-containing protein [Rikenellaceae bacterium]